MTGKIFINYRRDDERAMAARVRDRLVNAFGEANVFMDVDNLLAGQRFDKALEKELAETSVLIAVIGPRWMDILSARKASGERDYVRDEIVAALARGITVIPLLVEGANLPRANIVPEDMRMLFLHQKHDVTHEHFSRDVNALIDAIGAGQALVLNRGRKFLSRNSYIGAAAVIALGVTAFAAISYFKDTTSNDKRLTLTGEWKTGDGICLLTIYEDNGDTIKGDCPTATVSHHLTGIYDKSDRSRVLIKILRKNGSCETSVDGYFQILDNYRMRTWQQGWHGCDREFTHDPDYEGVLIRRS